MKISIILALLALTTLSGCSSLHTPNTPLREAERSCSQPGLIEYIYTDPEVDIRIKCQPR